MHTSLSPDPLWLCAQEAVVMTACAILGAGTLAIVLWVVAVDLARPWRAPLRLGAAGIALTATIGLCRFLILAYRIGVATHGL
jgi:hypothetical protein